MEDITPASSTVVPTIDLSPFMPGGDKSKQKKVMDEISEACTNLGVFYIENHGVSLETCEKFLTLNNMFFRYPVKVKEMATEIDESMAGTGYGKRQDKYHDYEYLLLVAPDVAYNGVPIVQPRSMHKNFNHDYRKYFDELWKSLEKTAQILEDIINDCLGLPPNFLKKYNDDRSLDFMTPLFYAPGEIPLVSDAKVGIIAHEDPQFLTITLQDDVSGLQVFQDEEWIPTIPTKVKLVVVVSDLVQALSNKQYKHVTHRALKNKEHHRLAVDYVYCFGPEKWIEPLRLTPEEISTKPHYRGFLNKDYLELIRKDFLHPPPKVEDIIDLKYYEI